MVINQPIPRPKNRYPNIPINQDSLKDRIHLSKTTIVSKKITDNTQIFP